MHIGCIAVPSVNKVCGGVTTESAQNPCMLSSLTKYVRLVSYSPHIILCENKKKIKSFA